jgi:hypothetical protein
MIRLSHRHLEKLVKQEALMSRIDVEREQGWMLSFLDEELFQEDEP